jgi:hypothetical protein
MSTKIAFDAGFGQTKLFTGSRTIITPSAVAKPGEMMAGMSTTADIYTYNGKCLVVGETALRPGLYQDYELSVDWLLAHVPFFLLHALDKAQVDIANIDTIITGLPIAAFSRRDEVVAILNNMGIPNVITVPQGVGALQAYVHEYASRCHPDDEGLVIDIGANTVITIAHNGYQADAMGSNQMNEMGIMAVAKTLQGVFKAMTGSEYSVIEAAKAIRTHEIKSKGQRIDVSAQVEAALNNHVETLINSIAIRYKQSIDRLDHVILAGGGAYLIRKHLPQDWPVVVLEQPEFANVRGYFRAV